MSEHEHEPGGVLPEVAAPRAGPAVPGDVLVRTVADGLHRIYVLSTVPGPDQLRFSSLSEAARAAREYASLRQVDVWADDGAGAHSRLARFRPAVSGSSAAHPPLPAPRLPAS